MRKNAIRSVLSSKLRGEKVRVVDSLDLPSPKTKEMLRLLETLKLSGKVLFVDREVGNNLELAARNLKRIGVARASALNVVELLHHDTLVLTRSAAEVLVEIYAS
jgi:large subunit ribosomal protein L4